LSEGQSDTRVDGYEIKVAWPWFAGWREWERWMARHFKGMAAMGFPLKMREEASLCGAAFLVRSYKAMHLGRRDATDGMARGLGI